MPKQYSHGGRVNAGGPRSGGSGPGGAGPGGAVDGRAPRSLRQRMSALGNLRPFLRLIWRIHPGMAAATLLLRLARALLPVATLFVGKLIVDEVLRLAGLPSPPSGLRAWLESGLATHLLVLLGAELALAILSDLLGRLVSLLEALLAELFANTTSIQLMEHAARLDLEDFEDSEVQDQLERARRQAAGRSGLLSQLFGQAQDVVTIAAFAAGLVVYAPWLILLLILAVVPAFLGESHFNAQSYELALRDADVLILDEPTAALDARSEFEVFQRFAELSRGKTAVIISHRFSTVRRAHRILVLAGGEIEASGTTS